MIAGLAEWREAIRVAREADEQRWGELTNAVQAMVYQVANQQSAEAEESAQIALDLEYELLGHCDNTDALCTTLGVQIPELRK